MGSPDGAKPSEALVRKFEQALDNAENLQLPLNKVLLYREAAVALMPSNKPQAIVLLKRALGAIEAAEERMKAEKTPDERSFKELEFHRLPVIMLMERIDPEQAVHVLSAPQTADRDTAFQALFFERLHNPALVYQAGLHKLDYGPSPAVVGAYDVLKKSSPARARALATALVLQLGKSDPANPDAVRSAFGLLRLLRNDVGALAPKMILDPSLLGEDQMRDLFNFIGDAFLAAKEPEMLILGQRPGLYVAALEEYAPIKAQEVKLLSFALPNAKSKIFDPPAPRFDANHPDPATLTPEQIRLRLAIRNRINAQVQASNEQIAELGARVEDRTLTQKEREDALFAAVEQANRALSLARYGATTLEREAFREGEVELYNLGMITGVIDHVSNVLQSYSNEHPQVAEAAALNLDGYEVQTEVSLQIAIFEMTGVQPFLVPPAKPTEEKATRKPGL